MDIDIKNKNDLVQFKIKKESQSKYYEIEDDELNEINYQTKLINHGLLKSYIISHLKNEEDEIISEEENLNNINNYFIDDKNEKVFLSNNGNKINPELNEYLSFNNSLNNASNPFIISSYQSNKKI